MLDDSIKTGVSMKQISYQHGTIVRTLAVACDRRLTPPEGA